MRTMTPILMSLGLLTKILWAGPIPTPASSSYAQGLGLLKKGSRSLDIPTLTAALQIFEACPQRSGDGFSRDYRAAQACLGLTRAYDLARRRGMAEKILSRGILCAQRAVSQAPDSADTHALLARLYEVKLMYGDMFTGMDIGPKAGAENKKALALDPQNPQVQLALGVQYVMAPPIGGGDVPKGILTLQEALRLDPKMDEAYYWLAKAYRKQNKRPEFEKALKTGMKLNPLNPLFQGERDNWKP